MKDLKLWQKIVLISVAIAIGVTIFYSVQERGGPGEFALGFGVMCLLEAIAYLFVSLFLFIGSAREWSKGFLLSAGVLFLLSGISCGLGAGI